MNAGVRALENLPKDEATPDSGWRFRYVSDLCDRRLEHGSSWTSYDIDTGRQPKDKTLKGYFRAWVDEYRDAADRKEHRWISDAELVRTLRDSIPTPCLKPETLYLTLPGEQHDRIRYIEEAIARNPDNESLETDLRIFER